MNLYFLVVDHPQWQLSHMDRKNIFTSKMQWLQNRTLLLKSLSFFSQFVNNSTHLFSHHWFNMPNMSLTLVAQGVTVRLTGHLLEAFLPQGDRGIEKVNKIVMCIGAKLCYCLQKLQTS